MAYKSIWNRTKTDLEMQIEEDRERTRGIHSGRIKPASIKRTLPLGKVGPIITHQNNRPRNRTVKEGYKKINPAYGLHFCEKTED